MIEAAGIPTVMVGNLPELVRYTNVPRAVFVPFPRGAMFGEPHHVDKQRRVLRAVLDWLERATPEDRYLTLKERWEPRG